MLEQANRLAEGDIVLLRPKLNASAKPILTKPLRKDALIQTHKGTISHSQIIGARVRDKISTHLKTELRLLEPTLAEYASLTPRIVTPVGELFCLLSMRSCTRRELIFTFHSTRYIQAMPVS